MDNIIKNHQNFLSLEVQKLLESGTPPQNCHNHNVWVTSDWRINWDKVKESLSDLSEKCESAEWFMRSVSVLCPLLGECLVALTQHHHHHSQPLSLLNWTHQEAVLSTCVQLLEDGRCDTDNLVALLVVTAITERALGDVIWSEGQQVPFLLRDLLLSPDLNRLLGSTRILVLRILVGSVLGLNLRNLAWHGFLTPAQAHPAFASALILILVDCGRVLQKSRASESFRVAEIPVRPMISFEEGLSVCGVFKDVCVSRVVMEQLLLSSPLVPSVMAPAWLLVLHLIESHRYGLGLSLLLPLLEASLRCLFTQTNNCPGRLLTAQTSAFYTTLDQILHPLVPRQDCGELDSSVCDHGENYGSSISCSNLTLPDCAKNGCSSGSAHNNHNVTQDCSPSDNKEDTELSDHFSITSESNIECRDYKTDTKMSGEANSKDGAEENCTESSVPNLTLLILGRKTNEALHDLLNFIQGPRVRDRVSHGEADLQEVPSELVHHVLCLSLLILSLEFSAHSDHSQNCTTEETEYKSQDSSDNSPNCTREIIDCESKEAYDDSHLTTPKQYVAELQKCIDNYKVIFHPSAQLHRRLIECISCFDKWLSWKRVNTSELAYDAWTISESTDLPKILTFKELGASHETTQLGDISKFLAKVSQLKCKVLYRPKIELEIISLLLKIISNIHSALGSMEENLAVKYSQFTEKKLRSRQRETYRRQLNSIPRIVESLFLSSQVVYLLFSGIDKVADTSSKCTGLLLKVLRNILKVQENTVSYTSLTMNRWDEALQIAKDNFAIIQKTFGN